MKSMGFENLSETETASNKIIMPTLTNNAGKLNDES